MEVLCSQTGTQNYSACMLDAPGCLVSDSCLNRERRLLRASMSFAACSSRTTFQSPTSSTTSKGLATRNNYIYTCRIALSNCCYRLARILQLDSGSDPISPHPGELLHLHFGPGSLPLSVYRQFRVGSAKHVLACGLDRLVGQFRVTTFGRHLQVAGFGVREQNH